MSVQLTVVSGVIGLIGRVAGGKDKPDDYDKLARRNALAAPKGVEKRTPSRREDLGGVHCVWLNESHASTGVLVYLHGGSYVLGPVGLQWSWPSVLADLTGMAAVVVHYGMPPQLPYPRAVEDAVAVIDALRERGIGPIVIMGDSAGGGLTVATTYRLRDTGRELPAGLVLHSPWLDLTMSNPESLAMAPRDVMLVPKKLDIAAKLYAGGVDIKHPEISPLYGDTSGLPPSLTYVGDAEMFLPEDRDWVAKCVASGCRAELRIVPGGFHVSTSFVTVLPEAKVAVRQQADFVRELITT